MSIKEKRFPVCGPRQPVYDFMRGLGFSMSNWSDKHWNAADGIQVQIYGAGSMARVYRKDEKATDCELDSLAEQIHAIRQPAP
jgi:hypothetical protein